MRFEMSRRATREVVHADVPRSFHGQSLMVALLLLAGAEVRLTGHLSGDARFRAIAEANLFLVAYGRGIHSLLRQRPWR